MFQSDEIIKELKKLNAAIAYQTKLFENIFEKKDETTNNLLKQKMFMKQMMSSISNQFKMKGVDPRPFQDMMNGITNLIGDEKNEH